MTPIVLAVPFLVGERSIGRATATSLMQIFVGEAPGRDEHGNVAATPGDDENPPLLGFADEPAEMSA